MKKKEVEENQNENEKKSGDALINEAKTRWGLPSAPG